MLKKMNAKQKVRKKKGGEGGEIRRKKIFFLTLPFVLVPIFHAVGAITCARSGCTLSLIALDISSGLFPISSLITFVVSSHLLFSLVVRCGYFLEKWLLSSIFFSARDFFFLLYLPLFQRSHDLPPRYSHPLMRLFIAHHEVLCPSCRCPCCRNVGPLKVKNEQRLWGDRSKKGWVYL